MLRASPQMIYLLLGKTRALAIAPIWRDSLPLKYYVMTLDTSMNFLFGWTSKQISTKTKYRCYPHLYSYASVKLVVHWFQIIRAGRFQAYDEDAGVIVGSSSYVPQKFWTRGIKTPIAILHGSRDALSNINCLREDLPVGGIIYDYEVPEYEHLDFLWADTAETEVYTRVVDLLKKNTWKPAAVNGVHGMDGMRLKLSPLPAIRPGHLQLIHRSESPLHGENGGMMSDSGAWTDLDGI